jgi:hypothetical protein
LNAVLIEGFSIAIGWVVNNRDSNVRNPRMTAPSKDYPHPRKFRQPYKFALLQTFQIIGMISISLFSLHDLQYHRDTQFRCCPHLSYHFNLSDELIRSLWLTELWKTNKVVRWITVISFT